MPNQSKTDTTTLAFVGGSTGYTLSSVASLAIELSPKNPMRGRLRIIKINSYDHVSDVSELSPVSCENCQDTNVMLSQ